MPLYEYECESCGRRFELIRKFSDAPLESCPTCGGKVQKQASSPAIQFKGTGWYVTDYAKKSGEKSDGDGSKAETKPSGDTGRSESGKSETEKTTAKTGDTSTSSESKPSASTPSSTTDTGSKNS